MAEIQQTRTESVELLLAQLTQARLDERMYRPGNPQKAKQAEAEYNRLYNELEQTGIKWKWKDGAYRMVEGTH